MKYCKHQRIEGLVDLKICNNELEIIQKTKYLGVQIDNSLNWKEHIKTVSQWRGHGVVWGAIAPPPLFSKDGP